MGEPREKRRVSYATEEDGDTPAWRRKIAHAPALSPSGAAYFTTPAAPRPATTDFASHLSAGQTVRNSRFPHLSSLDDTAAPSPPISLHLDMLDMQRAGEARASTATPLEGSARAPRLEAAASQSGVTGLHGNVPVRPSRLVGKLQFDETAVSVFRRLGQKPLTTGVKEVDDSVPGGGLAYPTVLELVGLSGTGKTEFLLKFCAANLLPQDFDGVFIGGPGAAFVYCCVGMIPSTMTVRLVDILDKFIHDILDRTSLDKRDWHDFRRRLVADSLSRLYIVPCSSAIELLCSMRSLSTMLTHRPGVRAVILDCLSTLQWFDKTSTRGNSDLPPSMLVDRALGVLHTLAQEHRLVVLGSRWASNFRPEFSATTASAARPQQHHQSFGDSHGDAFGKRWQNAMVTHRLHLSASVRNGRVDYSGTIKTRNPNGQEAAQGRTFKIPHVEHNAC